MIIVNPLSLQEIQTLETVWEFLILALMWRFYAINMSYIMNPKKNGKSVIRVI